MLVDSFQEMYPFLYYILPTVLILVGIRKYRESKWKKCENSVKLFGKVAIVTGANSGVGYEIAKELCKRGADVIFACRNKELALKAIAKIEGEIKNQTNKIYLELDLASVHSIKKFAENIKSQYNKIDILINNAGVSFPDKSGVRTKDDFEIHFGVNHLGHFLLTNLLIDCLENAHAGRVVIITSSLHQRGKINFENLNLEKPSEVKNLYANSKLANVYFCKELAKRTLRKGIHVYCLCPGWVFTGLFRNHIRRMILYFIFVVPAAFLFMRSPKQGAQTAIFCATDENIKNESGYIYRNCMRFKTKVDLDDEVSRKLWDTSVNMIKKVDATVLL